MEKYLTKKSMPGTLTVILEILAALVTGLATLLWIAVGVYGLVADGLVLAHLFLVIFALPWAAVWVFVLRRWYARRRAKRIVRLLYASERGAMTCSQLSRVGVYSPDRTVARLTERKYMQGVAEVQGEIRLKNRTALSQVCAYCGAPLPAGAEGTGKCPGCGARAAASI